MAMEFSYMKGIHSHNYGLLNSNKKASEFEANGKLIEGRIAATKSCFVGRKDSSVVWIKSNYCTRVFRLKLDETRPIPTDKEGHIVFPLINLNCKRPASRYVTLC